MKPALRKQFKNLRRAGRHVYRSMFFPPFVVFVAMMFVTYWSFRASILSIQRDQNTAVSARQDAISATIDQRLSTYEEILVGGAGLFRASQTVTEEEWHNYIQTFDVTNRYPGVQALGYIRSVPAAGLPGLVSSMQAQGFEDFKVTPAEPKRDTYTAVVYTEPDRNSTGRGLDLSVLPGRREVMEKARDTGTAAITEPLESAQRTTDQLVFILFVPQYQTNTPISTPAERQKALRGYLYAGFRSFDFFDKLLPISEQDTDVALTINSEDGTTFYKSPNYESFSQASNLVRGSQTMEVYGTRWNINYVFNADTLSGARRRNAPIWTVIAGSLFAILLSEVVYLLLKARAQELARQRDKAVDFAKDELLSLASHQLRTPATTVKQYIGMLIQGFAGDLTTTQTNLLNKAYAGNERQLYIINEMLYVAKVDSGRITLAKQPLNFNELVQDVVAEAKVEADKVGHQIKAQVPKQPIVSWADEHMVRMAVENLVSNAIKYTLDRGKIQVKLRKLGTDIHISIKDNGIGIAKSDIPKLYKLFTRLNDKRTQLVSGTGVGLYLTKHLINLHNGTVEVQSEPGKGSTFTIILPYEKK